MGRKKMVDSENVMQGFINCIKRNESKAEIIHTLGLTNASFGNLLSKAIEDNAEVVKNWSPDTSIFSADQFPSTFVDQVCAVTKSKKDKCNLIKVVTEDGNIKFKCID